MKILNIMMLVPKQRIPASHGLSWFIMIYGIGCDKNHELGESHNRDGGDLR